MLWRCTESGMVNAAGAHISVTLSCENNALEALSRQGKTLQPPRAKAAAVYITPRGTSLTSRPPTGTRALASVHGATPPTTRCMHATVAVSVKHEQHVLRVQTCASRSVQRRTSPRASDCLLRFLLLRLLLLLSRKGEDVGYLLRPHLCILLDGIVSLFLLLVWSGLCAYAVRLWVLYLLAQGLRVYVLDDIAFSPHCRALLGRAWGTKACRRRVLADSTARYDSYTMLNQQFSLGLRLRCAPL